ncbi:MAG: MOSC domain-containing protein [Melioribacteraceae bacterium]|nr:MOSC domain-containing protein [Melioribacteraceae bacterium]
MKIKYLNIGQPEGHFWNGEKVVTSIFKKSIDRPVKVNQLGIVGDTQSDKEHHGGMFKAVYAYPFEHYEIWKEKLSQTIFDIPSFGENLTTIGMFEKEVLVGDEFKIGSVILKATEPRLPCRRLNIRLNNRDAVKIFSDLRLPGIYFSVVQEGTILPEDDIELVFRDENSISIYDINNLFLSRTGDKSLIEQASKLHYLREKWKQRFEDILKTQSNLNE